MKTDRRLVRICRAAVGAGIGAVMAAMLSYGAYRGVYEYIYYRDYKSVRSIKLRHPHASGDGAKSIATSVKFVSAMHDSGLARRLLVRAENGKNFFIMEFDDGHVQLILTPAKRYLGIGWLTAYYDIADAATEEKLRKMLDMHCRAE